MKKFVILSLLALVASAVYFTACQKDSTTDPRSQTEQENAAVTERGPNILVSSLTTYCTCSSGHTCGPWAYSTVKRNALKIVLNNTTHNYYNASGPGLRYRIYPGSSCSGTPIADFYCNKKTVQYASSSLANGGTYSVFISTSGASSPCYGITVGNCNGQSCGISPERTE